ncbi:MAG: ATP-binding protein [Magnetococcus sp. YQC-3]
MSLSCPVLPDDAGIDILLVDDQPLTERLLRRMLQGEEGAGLRLEYLQDPLLAESRVQISSFDLILLDLAMPGMDGLELLQRLRALPQTGLLPIVMLTANDDVAQKARAFALGANDYLVKLPDRVEMLARLRYYGTAHRARLRQQRAERELRKQGAHLRAVLDNALDAIITINPGGRIVDVNPATLQLLGYSRDAMLGQPLADFILSDLFWANCTRLLQEGVSVEELTRGLGKKWEVDGLRENGQQIDLEMAIVPTLHAEGGRDELHLTAFLQDVTDQRQLLRSLEMTLSVAEAASRVKNDFLSTMSHEIRTPMNAVIGLTDLALQTPLPPKTRDYLSKIQGASHSLMRIINDILDFSKMDAGRLQLESVHFTLSDLFAYLEGLFRKQAEEKKISLLLEIAADCRVTLLGDAFRLEQVLINLLANAIKFTDAGRVTCRVERTLAPEGEGREWFAFAVQDTGIGMTAEEMGRLFNPFVQADSSTTRRYGGSGLGLSICKRIVDAMDGRMAVESQPGEGSLFRFSIPLVQSEAEAEQLFPVPGEGPDISDWVVDLDHMDRSALQKYRAHGGVVDLAALQARLGGGASAVGGGYADQPTGGERVAGAGGHSCGCGGGWSRCGAHGGFAPLRCHSDGYSNAGHGRL